MKSPRLREYGVDVPSSDRRSLRDLLVELKAREASLVTGEDEARWRAIIRWRVAHVGRGVRDLYDAMYIKRVVTP
jgi:hypothetical protein